MRVCALVGKKADKWETIMLGENYSEQRQMFFAIQEAKGDGYEAVIFMDSATGTLKRKIFSAAATPKYEPKPEPAIEATEPKRHRKNR